jgi:RNA polymerase sigma factor (sigma-70 family)
MHLLTVIANKVHYHTRQRVEVAELISDGWIGLRQAAIAFDPSRGVKFASFASRRIHGAMLDAIRDRDYVSRNIRKAGQAPALISTSATTAQVPDGRRDLDVGGMIEDPNAEARVHAIDSAEVVDRLFAGFNRAEQLLAKLFWIEGFTMKAAGAVIGFSESRACQMLGNLVERVKAKLSRADDL